MLDVAFLDQAEETFNHEQDFVPPAKCTGCVHTTFSLHVFLVALQHKTYAYGEPDNNSEHCNDFVLEGSPFVVALNNAYVDYDGARSSSLFLYNL